MAKTSQDFKELSAGAQDYENGIATLIAALFSGAISPGGFIGSMGAVIQVGLQRAWEDGAKECGILPGEMTMEESAELAAVVASEISHLPALVNFIQAKRSTGDVATVMQRAPLWANRYDDITNRAKELSCADQKLVWRYDPAKEHCTHCARLNGKVKRASYWKKRGIHPQQPPNPKLDCGGWRCGCVFDVTNQPLSRGRLPGEGR